MVQTATRDRFVVTHSAFPGLTFRTSAGMGGETAITQRRHTPGGPQEAISGRQKLTDVTLTVSYTRDTEAIALRAAKGEKFPGTITRQMLDLDDIPIPGQQLVLAGCVLKSWAVPDTDVDSEEPGDLTLVFTPGSAA